MAKLFPICIILFISCLSSSAAWNFFGSSKPEYDPEMKGECVLWQPPSGADPLTFNRFPFQTVTSETFHPEDLIATHASIPPGTYATVTNTRLGSGQSVNVRIVGPPIIPVIGRPMELSKGAFQQVAHISDGVFPCIISHSSQTIAPGIGPGQLHPPGENYPNSGEYTGPGYGESNQYPNRPSYPRPNGGYQAGPQDEFISPQQQGYSNSQPYK